MAKKSISNAEALKENTAALKAHTRALKQHTAALVAHTAALHSDCLDDRKANSLQRHVSTFSRMAAP